MSVEAPIDRDSWTTPIKLYHWLDAMCDFDLDAAADKYNALHPRFITKEENALNWKLEKDVRAFCNPPYSICGQFADHLLSQDTNVVLLLPVRSDRLWFQKWLHHEDIHTCWITGRLHFGGSGKGAFMYSVLFIRGFEERIFPNWMDASHFNDNGKGGAKS